MGKSDYSYRVSCVSSSSLMVVQIDDQPLHLVCKRRGSAEAMSVLLSAGADVRASNNVRFYIHFILK